MRLQCQPRMSPQLQEIIRKIKVIHLSPLLLRQRGDPKSVRELSQDLQVAVTEVPVEVGYLERKYLISCTKIEILMMT